MRPINNRKQVWVNGEFDRRQVAIYWDLVGIYISRTHRTVILGHTCPLVGQSEPRHSDISLVQDGIYNQNSMPRIQCH